jgi:hypothetical protein
MYVSTLQTFGNISSLFHCHLGGNLPVLTVPAFCRLHFLQNVWRRCLRRVRYLPGGLLFPGQHFHGRGGHEQRRRRRLC